MKKSIYTLFLCFLCVFCLLGGCSQDSVDMKEVYQENAFRIVRQANADGSISLAYIFPVNTQILKSNGLGDSDIRTFRFCLATYINALSEQNQKKAVEGVEVEKAAYFQDVDGIGFTVNFDDIDAQKSFFGSEDQEEEQQNSSTLKTSGFFVKKSEISVDFPVSTQQSAENLKQVCKLAMISWSNMSDFADVSKLLAMYEESNMIYHFSSKQEGLKSEICFDKNNFHHNVFIKSQKDISQGNTKIVFFVNQPNTPVWYASAVVFVVGGMILVYFVVKRKQKKQNDNM